MKRVSSSGSVGAFMSTYPNSKDAEPKKDPIYADVMNEEEESCGVKKRRLRVDQVKALEKNFEVENKLDPERKVRLAGEVGLQPRQVAVWFQNRRARWKTKQLDKDYAALKASHDSLLHKYQTLQTHNHSLLNQKMTKIEELKLKVSEQRKTNNIETTMDVNDRNNTRDGSSDSDSSAILNEGRSPSPYVFPNDEDDSNYNVLEDSQKAYEPQFVKIEEHDIFGTGLFSDEQLPNLSWANHWD